MDIREFDELKNVITQLRKVCPLKEYDIDITYWGSGGWSTTYSVDEDGVWNKLGEQKASRTKNGIDIKITLSDSERPKTKEEYLMNYSPDGSASPMNMMVIGLINSTQLAQDWSENENK